MLRELKGSTTTTRGRRRAKRRRTATTIVVVVLVFLLLLAGLALLYVWYTGNETELPESAVKPSAPSQLTKPPEVADNVPVGVAVSALSSPIAAGSNASISIRTKQKAACNITVTYGTEKSHDTGLVPKTADEYGVVSWSWTVEASRAAGTYPIDITCAKDDKSGYRQADLVVTK